MPFDLNRARAERDHTPYEFTLGSHTFSIPPPLDWDEDVINAFAVEDLPGGFRLLLADQWKAFRAYKPSLGDYRDLLADLDRWAGLDAERGEARRPSGPSSRSTGTPSKRTSTGSTGSSSRRRPGAAGRNLEPVRPAGTSDA